MSLYNALFGTNNYAHALLMILGIDSGSVPRFRDCYLGEDGRIVVYTRTGGGNRDAYENPARYRDCYPEYFGGSEEPYSGPWNEDLRKLPGFVSDEDDDFDSTYAYFYFDPPAEMADLIKEIGEKQGDRNPRKAFEQMMADLKSGADTPEAKRAMEVGKRIFGAIDKGDKTIIEV